MWWENWKLSDISYELGIHGRVKLKYILNKWGRGTQ
jgi:hypothetical protein